MYLSTYCVLMSCLASVCPVLGELKANPGSDTAVQWSCLDFADGEYKQETLCIRFKTVAELDDFKKIYNEARNTNAAGDAGAAVAPAAAAAAGGAAQQDKKDRVFERLQSAGNPWYASTSLSFQI
jgi:hypothetical protein